MINKNTEGLNSTTFQIDSILVIESIPPIKEKMSDKPSNSIEISPSVVLRDKIERKLRLASELFEMAYNVKKFQLRIKFPELSERELNYRAYALIEKGCRS